MLNFSAINTFNQGPRDSFEELVCVLAKREYLQGAVEFQPNEGSGGDGGVEAIWLLDSGRKVGYQAKYFLSIGDSQWSQMDESVKQALKVHPELETYVFALPKDLTPDRGGRGKSEWKKWSERVEKWKGWASEQSIDIEFELWSETDLREMLLRQGNTALVKYWFGNDVLNHAWFEKQVSVAIGALEDRYNPEDHIEVSIESLFDIMTRGPRITEQLSKAFSDFEKIKIPKIKFTTEELDPEPSLLLEVEKSFNEVLKYKEHQQYDFDCNINVEGIIHAYQRFHKALWAIESRYLSVNKKDLPDEDKRQLESIIRDLRKASSTSNQLRDVFDYKYWRAESQQSAVIHGSAGAGKSHVIGEVAERRIKTGLPTVLILGQSLSEVAFWDQLGSILGIDAKSSEDILGLLNAAGERIEERVLLLFDAINEGIGAQYWRQNLSEVINAVQQYPYLALVVSCREEYLPYAIPESLSESVPKFRIDGFSTQEELENAAIQYLDKKGISRPNTPWLSPEFSNPLFLKSTSEALHAKGEIEFPKGLTGISQMMVLYLDALSWRISLKALDMKSIATSIKQCVKLIANKMAEDACDYVEFEQAISIAEGSFKGRSAPEGKTWLDILLEVSLFRRDPPPYSDDIDPFNSPSELIRFSFQRFQDHLMAAALVDKVTRFNATEAFDGDGPLNFLFYKNTPDLDIRYEYAGLVSALSTIYPEKLELEFVQTLPNWEQLWHEQDLLQKGFSESFKWRDLTSFSEASRELLNLLDEHWIDPLDLLLEVSMTADHPFNALYLHSRLINFPMSERDSRWTRHINWAYREDYNQMDRVVSWALQVPKRSADVKHMELCSIVLAWSLSSSYMSLRDRATKALTSLFLSHSEIFNFLLEKLNDCDDPYVIERLYAAAYGACCIDQNKERLKSYSQSTYSNFFSGPAVPVGLLARDYALGIIELADSKGVLEEEVNLDTCFHPHGSDKPKFELNLDEVEAIAEESGGKEIFDSASSEWGDYGKYSIPGRVNSFLTTPLCHSTPMSKTARKETFVQELIEPHEDRILALEVYESVTRFVNNYSLSRIFEDSGKGVVELSSDEENMSQDIINARSHLESLLNEEELERLKSEYLSAIGYEEYSKIDVQQCRLWVVKRAYDLGWSSELFANDGSGTGYSRHDNDFERIGKKYQRIALDELLARLADNYWMLQDWPEKPAIYKYSHQNFYRDIEPTILPNCCASTESKTELNDWMLEPIINLPSVDESNLKEWPFEQNPTQSMEDKLVRTDRENRKWLVLYEYNGERENYPERHRGEHGARIEEFRFLYCVFLKQGMASELASLLSDEQHLDGHLTKPREFTDGPFLREAFWRDTWASEKYDDTFSRNDKEIEFAIPAAFYLWESHMDKSLPDGCSQYMPQKWFADELNIEMDERRAHLWRDSQERVIIRSNESSDEQSIILIDEESLNKYAEDFKVEPVWLMIAERSSWPGGGNAEFCGRRAEGMVWREGNEWQQVEWNKDTKR